MKKKKIVHIIDDLIRGGAETMMIDLLPDISEQYEITLVTLRPTMEFDKEQIACVRHLSLQYYSIKDLPKTIKQLRKIIITVGPDLVRSQLFWSTLITRVACPKHIPLIFSVHATMNEDPIAFYKKWYLYILERVTYNRRQYMIGVTQAVIESFKKVHPQFGKTFLLHNFVRKEFFSVPYEVTFVPGKKLKLVAVSNLRLIKNIPYLVEALHLLKGQNISLDIYGNGQLEKEIQDLITKYGLNNVVLKGKIMGVHQVLSNYDVFISSSTVEGFGIAVAEAVSVGLPVIVSDIPVYREICGDKAIYLDNQRPESLEKILLGILEGHTNLIAMSKTNKEYALQRFSKKGYVDKLSTIYQTIFETS